MLAFMLVFVAGLGVRCCRDHREKKHWEGGGGGRGGQCCVETCCIKLTRQKKKKGYSSIKNFTVRV